jgi:hypothetical protein
MSAFAADAATGKSYLEPGTSFLQKSFRSEELCRRVRETLLTAQAAGLPLEM